MVCDNCHNEFEELVTRDGVCFHYYVEWVCKDCFFELEKVTFEEYSKEHRDEQI